MLHPSFEEFSAHARPGALVPVFKEILADLETPVSTYMKLAEGQQYAFLFESVEKADRIGQYSFIGANPSIIFRSKGTSYSLTRDGQETRGESENPLNELRALMKQYQPAKVSGLPSFHGGAVGYMSYDQVRFFERLPDTNPDTLNLPDLYFFITDTMVVFDHVNNKIKIVSNAHIADDARAAYDEAIRKIAAIEEKLRAPLRAPEVSPTPHAPLESNFTRESFCAAVEKAKEYIRAGDIFQVVLSQRFRRKVSATPITLYRALRCINPSPYMLLMQFPEFALAGSSPEVMTQVKNGTCMVRPIAGTRKRGKTEEEDFALEKDLLADEKEIAEHVMLVDLGRNDIGRISTAGTVAPGAGQVHGHRALLPCDAHRQRSGRANAAGARRLRRARRHLPHGHGQRCAEDPRDGNHRRAGTRAARTLFRRLRLHRLRWRNGHLHPDPHHGGQGRQRLLPGRRRHRLRQRPGSRSTRRPSTRPPRSSAPWTSPRKASNHDRPHRQLRLLHLQPRPILRRDGIDIRVFRNDAITVEEGVRELKPDHIVVSPGPCTPTEAGISVDLIKQLGPEIPTFGVCLGHQSIGQAFGGDIVRADRIMHGKVSEMFHTGHAQFAGVPSPFTATRYHSLVIKPETCPPCLEVTAKAKDNEIMAVAHRELPIWGVQFHPESILTPNGKQLLRNFLGLRR
jgi:anthranilate synthase component 1